MGEYRYLKLKCEATIARRPQKDLIEVTIKDLEVNPNQKALVFDPELDSLILAPDGSIELIAAFEEPVFDTHVKSLGFNFKNAVTGAPITQFAQLETANMDPVKPPTQTP